MAKQLLGSRYICTVLILLCVSIMVNVNLVLNSVAIVGGVGVMQLKNIVIVGVTAK